MTENHDLINKLIDKLEALYNKQSGFVSEINALRAELYTLQNKTQTTEFTPNKTLEELPNSNQKPENTEQIQKPLQQQEALPKIAPIRPKEDLFEEKKTETPIPPKAKSLEKRIGENVLNKIGIAITVIGVAIGAKYSIENNLISPVTRIIMGYIMAIGLLGFGLKLKQKYTAYSAVLVSGAIVILYFITYFSYSLYSLIPQVLTFGLMVVFTVFAVIAALSYNKQIIAHIGLVGAYAVPFLLSNGSGQVAVLFSYMAVINCGILFISFKRHWKPLFYSAFALSWIIFGTWFISDYQNTKHFSLALVFLFIFFTQFYVTFLAYKLIKNETYQHTHILILLCNAFLFFVFGYAILDGDTKGKNLLGAFAVVNAIIHFAISALIYKKQLANKNLFYSSAGLVLVFITIAIPIQLDGNWVTVLWATEAALLFWIGRTKAVALFEKIGYVLMMLATLSIIQDHSAAYFRYNIDLVPLLNPHFITSLLFVAAFIFISYVQRNKNFTSDIYNNSKWLLLSSYAVPAVLMASVYFAFRLELQAYFSTVFHQSAIEIPNGSNYNRTLKNYDIKHFGLVWVLNYSLLFLAALYVFNIRKLKNETLNLFVFGLSILTVLVFLTQGLYVFSELRDSYLAGSAYFSTGMFHIGIRYLSFGFLALVIYCCYHYVNQNSANKKLKLFYDGVLHISILWVLSSELIQWMVIGNSEQSYKLGLSILWAVYSFVLIAFGIWKSKQYLRIGGMILFGITLIKLFFYDIAHLNTISKTIVFVALGILLLIISFLYTKFKSRIDDEVTY